MIQDYMDLLAGLRMAFRKWQWRRNRLQQLGLR